MKNNFTTFRPEIKDVKIKKLDYETVYLDEFKGNADKEKYSRLRIFFRRERNFQGSNLKRIVLKVIRQIV